MKRSNKYQIYQIAISGLLLSLSFVLGIISKFVPFFRMPSGGGISLAMIPLTFSGLILGPVYGLVSGLLYGVFNMLVDGAFSWGFPSILLDYFLSYSSAFVCGFFSKYFYRKKIWSFIASLVLFILLRFICHFMSGILLYNPYVEEEGTLFSIPAIIYSTIYNIGYLLPTFIVSLLVSLIISQPIFNLLNNNIFITLGEKYEIKGSKKYSFDINSCLLVALSVISLLLSFIFKINLRDISINFGFLSIISLIIGVIVLIYCLLSTIFKKEELYNKNLNQIKIFKNNYYLYLTNIVLTIPIIMFSILSIVINYN